MSVKTLSDLSDCMTERSIVFDALAFAAHDAAIHAPLHDTPDDRPSLDDLALDEHEARLAGVQR